jgi:multicomponent Na+:H+ antiporter subunit F
MSEWAAGATGTITTFALAMLLIAMLLAVGRLLRGPTVPDRVIALDVIATITVSFMAVFAFKFDEPMFVDIAIVVAMIAFLGTVALAQYLTREART